MKDIALIVAGVHGSELSGVEVAHWIRVKLERRMSQDNGKWKPYYTTVIVPEIYPKSVELGRKCLDNKAQSKDRELIKRCGVTKKGREVDWKLHPGDKTTYVIPPNRQFPPPGRPLSHLSRRKKPGPVDPDGNPVTEDANRAAMPGGVPLLPETREFLRLVEKLKPKRIASIHAQIPVNNPDYGVDAPGIFVDPRYEYAERTGQRDPLEPLISARRRPFGTDTCKFDLALDPAFPVVGLIKQMNEWIAHNAFIWNNIPADGDDAARLKDFLGRKYGIGWMETAKIEKIAGVEIVKLSSGNRYVSLKLKGNRIDLDTDDGKSGAYWAAMERGKRIMYPISVAEKTEIARAAQSFRAERKRHATSMARAQAVAKKLEQLGFKPVKKEAVSAITAQGKRDDRLALEIAKRVSKSNRRLVPGNHLQNAATGGDSPPVVHYAASVAPPPGFSLGDWGPVDVREEKDPGDRDGAPVVTVEVHGREASGAFRGDGRQLVAEDCKSSLDPKFKPGDPRVFNRQRCRDLQAYADSLIEVFLAKNV